MEAACDLRVKAPDFRRGGRVEVPPPPCPRAWLVKEQATTSKATTAKRRATQLVRRKLYRKRLRRSDDDPASDRLSDDDRCSDGDSDSSGGSDSSSGSRPLQIDKYLQRLHTIV